MIKELLDRMQIDEERTPPPEVVLQNVNILFADKDPEVLRAFKQTTDYLGWKGTYVTSVTGIIEAMNNQCPDPNECGIDCPARGHCYDALVSGMNFFSGDGPRLTGITAARQIRKVRPNLPIVFVTSYVSTILKEEVRRVNAELIPKSVDIIDIFARVSQLVYWHRLTEPVPYHGHDRRKSSVYFGQERRRGTDRKVEIPEILSHTLEQVLRDKYTTHEEPNRPFVH